MKTSFQFALIVLALVFLCGTVSGREQDSRKFRTLVVLGGHPVDDVALAAMLDSLGNLSWKAVSHPDAHEFFRPDKSGDFDLILLYDAWDKIDEETQKDFLDLVASGKPVLALHHSLLSYSKWPEYATKLVGGRYLYLGEETLDGKKYGYSAVKDDVDLNVRVVDRNHPILKGIADFSIRDELYAKLYISPAANILLRTDFPGMETPLAWTLHHGRGKIFTFQLGHGKTAFENPSFQKIMSQAVDWLGRPERLRIDPPKEMMKQGWGRPNFVTYRNLDDDPAEECLGLFFWDKAHHAHYEITHAYWGIVDGKTNEVRFLSDDKTTIAESVDCVFKDGRWMLKMESFQDGKYEIDESGRVHGITVREYVAFNSETKKYEIVATETERTVFPETIPGLPPGSQTGSAPVLPDREPVAEPISVLILTGINGAHWWKGSTDAIQKTLENSGLFRCDVAVMNGSPDAVKPEDLDFTKYRLVVSNHVPMDWPETAKKNFQQYVENGGGLVLLHGATLAFPKWKEYNEMMGLGAWMDRNEKDGPYVYWKDGAFVRDETPGWAGHHGRQHSFAVVHRAPEHPILKGLPTEWMHFKDELYGKMRGPAQNMTVLATAYDDTDENRGHQGSDRHEPVLWTVDYGQGRVFVDALGHAGDDAPGIYALECTGFQVTFLRGCQWAATGEVSQAVPDDFPTATQLRFRRDFRP